MLRSAVACAAAVWLKIMSLRKGQHCRWPAVSKDASCGYVHDYTLMSTVSLAHATLYALDYSTMPKSAECHCCWVCVGCTSVRVLWQCQGTARWSSHCQHAGLLRTVCTGSHQHNVVCMSRCSCSVLYQCTSCCNIIPHFACKTFTAVVG